MNKKVKIAIGALAFILLITFTLMYFTIKKLRKENQIYTVQMHTFKDSANVYKTKAGEAYFKLNAAIIQSNALKGSLEVLGIENKDLRHRDIKKNDIISVLQAQLAMAGNDTIVLTDTVYLENGIELKANKFDWTNKYLSLDGIIREKVMDMNYSYKTDMTFITEQKRKETRVTAYLSDPNARITTGSSIVVKNKTPFYLQPWLWGVAGLCGGFFIAK